jgi:cobalt-zinc-cadmium efflux system outer membrane protein
MVLTGRCDLPRYFHRRQTRRACSLAGLLLVGLVTQPIRAQEKATGPVRPIDVAIPVARQQAPGASSNRSLTLPDAVSVFLRQNLELLAARYDIDTADAEKLTARLRPNPDVSVTFEDLPVTLNGPFVKEQTVTYGISQTLELGGKRRKRIDVANSESELARGEFQKAVWQLTNEFKKKFYAALLAEALLDLARENQQTFAETLRQSAELCKAGEISGLDLKRLEVEKLKFDTDVATSEGDYELAVRDVRSALGGDYRAMDVDVAGELDYRPRDFSLADLRDKALAARPDLKAAQLRERAADASVRLQNAQRIPDLSFEAGVAQTPYSTNTFVYGVALTLPLSDRNQGERAKALVEKLRAQNEQRQVTNQVFGDVDRALVAVEVQQRRVELYRTGVLAKVDEIQSLTEFSLKAGEGSTLELLDAIRTRRETLAAYYQALFDYHMALLDLELATATPLQ